MAMVIRKIGKEDSFQFEKMMKAFYHHAGNALPSDGEILSLLEKAADAQINLVFLGAFDNEKLAGMLSLTFCESSYKVSLFAWCDDLYVNEEYRKSGIGRALLKKAAEISRKKNCSNIMVGVGKNEAGAQKFYKSMGFADMECILMSLPCDSNRKA